MRASGRRFLTSLLLLLAAGLALGVAYGYPVEGLLIASLLALAWQARYLLAFLSAARSGNFTDFQSGDGIWQQIYSQFRYQRERATHHKQRYRQLLKEIRKSTDAMPDGAVILDRSNEIVMCNKASKSLAGLKPRKDRGQRIENILRDPAFAEWLERGDFSGSVEIASPLKTDAWLNCRIVPYGARQKLLFLRDVTEHTRVSKMRSDFIANASHELRSPLTVIRGYLESLAEDSDAPEHWVGPVQQMQAQAQRMTRIVSELLELSRLETAGPAENDEIVDIGELLAATVRAHAETHKSVDIQLQVETSVAVKGNANEMDSLVNNLINNAVRHTAADGRITLAWKRSKHGAVLAVSDNGEGIAEHHLPRLTERFFRVDNGRARSDGGVGLGLAIVKHILGRHDAELRISSELGVGSHFECHFPARRLSGA